MSDQAQDTGLGNSIEEQAAQQDKPLDPAESLHRAYIQSLEVDPDHAAKVIDYSKRLNLDPAFVDKHAGEIDLTVKAPTADDWKAYAKGNPKVSEFFKANEEAVAAAKDDFDKLGFLESVVTQWSTGIQKKTLEAQMTELQAAQGKEARERGTSTKFEQEIASIQKQLEPFNKTDESVTEAHKNDPWYQKFFRHPVYEGSQLLVDMTRPFVKLGGTDPEKNSFVSPGIAITGIDSPRTGAILKSLVSAMPQYSYDQEFGSAYAEYLGRTDKNGNKISQKAAADAAHVVGLINAATETFSDAVLLKAGSAVGKAAKSVAFDPVIKALEKSAVPGASVVAEKIAANPKVFAGMTVGKAIREAVWNYLESTATEVGTEVLQEGVTGTGGNAAQMLDARASGRSITDYELAPFSKIASDAFAVAPKVASGMLLTGGLFGSAHIASAYKQVKGAEETKNVYLALGENAKESKFRARLPEKHQELVAKLTKDGPVEHVFIPAEAAETYFQAQGIDAEQAAAELGISKQEFQDAKERGSDLKIPMSTWATKVVDTVHYQGLADDIKFSEGGLTNRQAQEVGADIERKIIDELKSITDEQEKKSPLTADDVAALREIKDVVESGQKEARPEGAQQKEWRGVERGNAELWQRFVRFRAMGTGKSIRETFEEMRPLIQRGDAAQAMAMAVAQGDALNQKSTGQMIGVPVQETKEFRNWFNKSKVVDEQGAPRVVYHGTVHDIASFSGLVWVTPDTSAASGYSQRQAFANRDTNEEDYRGADEFSPTHDKVELTGQNIIPLYASIQNPLDLTALDQSSSLKEVEKFLVEKGVIEPVDAETLDEIAVELSTEDMNISVNTSVPVWRAIEALDAYKDIKEKGFDGVKIVDTDIYGRPVYAYAAFSAEQVKSAIGNNGAFDPKNPNILFQSGSDLDMSAEARKARAQEMGFDTSKVYYHGAREDIKFFDPKKRGGNTGAPSAKQAFFFTDSANVASGYADTAKSQQIIDLENRQAKAEKLQRWDEFDQITRDIEQILLSEKETSGSNVLPVFLKLQNPLIVDFNGKKYRETSYAKHLSKAASGGHDGVIFKNTFDDADGKEAKPHDVVAVFEPSQIRSVNAAFDPAKAGESDILLQANENTVIRASMRMENKRPVIELMQHANQSSFIHESAHAWLEYMRQDAEAGIGTDEYKAQIKTVFDWLGFDGKGKFTREQQEKFARGFEQYLREGKAPSSALSSVFRLLSTWLKRIYKDAKELRVTLTDDVRAVMDRMISTEEEIARAESDAGVARDFGAFTKDEQAELSKLREEARAEAEGELIKKQMAEISEERKAELAKEREKLTEKARLEVRKQDIYQLINFIGEEFKLKDGEEREIARKYTQSKLDEVQARHWDAIAELAQYSSGDEMALIVLNATPIEQAIKERVDREMQQFAPLMNRQEIKDEAIAAVHNEKQMQVLALEKGILLRKLEERDKRKSLVSVESAKFTVKFAREKAREILQRQPVKSLRSFMPYITAEREAAIQAARAVARGDLAKAVSYKERQMLNHALAMEAKALKEGIERDVRFLEKQVTAKPETFKSEEHYAQAQGLLARFGFVEKEVERKETLAQWAARMEEKTTSVDLPDWILNEALKRDYRELTISELKDLRNAVSNIKQVANFEDRFYIIDQKVTIEELANQLREDTKEEGGKRPPVTQHQNWRDKLIANKEAIKFSLINPETMLRKMDGYEYAGSWWSTFMRPVNKAADAKIARIQKEITKMKDIFSVYSAKELAEMDDRLIFVRELGASLKKSEIMAMALNWGNETNRQRLLEGRNWDFAQVNQALEKYLDKRDWETIQKVWDHIDSFWPEIADLYRDLTGFAPDKVKAAEVQNAHGVFRGGYYPLKRDPRTIKGMEQMKVDASLVDEPATWKAATKNGHTKERVKGAVYPVSLDLGVYHRHVHEVIHDLTHRKLIIDLNRLMGNETVTATMFDALGVEAVSAIQDWVKAIAGQTPQSPVRILDKFAGWARRRTVLVALGARLSSMFQQIAGFTTTVAVDKDYGWGNLFHGIFSFYGKMLTNPGAYGEAHAFVTSKSQFMAERAATLDRDLSSAARRMFSKDKNLEKFAMYGIGMFDRFVTLPTWMEAYKVGLEKFEADETRAVEYADFIVRRSQGSGIVKDLPAIMRGTETQKLFTVFYSYMNNQLNLFYESLDQAQRKGLAAGAPFLLGRLFALWMMQVTLSEVLTFRAPVGDDEPDEEKAKFWMKKFMAYPFAMFPVAREASDVFLDSILGIKGQGYRPSPATGVVDAASRLLKAGSKAATGDGDAQDVAEAATKFGAYAVGYPDQFNAWTWNLIDYMGGEMSPRPGDILRRRPRKERNE